MPDQNDLPSDVAWAISFHETYERLAPSYGYETRADTKQFDPDSQNGQLMRAVMRDLVLPLVSALERLRKATLDDREDISAARSDAAAAIAKVSGKQ